MYDPSPSITPALLKQMTYARIPFPKTSPSDPFDIISYYFSPDDSLMRHRCQPAWPALKAIAAAGPGAVPDVARYLPVPADDPAFPELAFGLHILCDQAPRVLFRDLDRRWLAWFGRVTRKLFDRMLALPAHLRPWDRRRWAGVAFEYWFQIMSEWNTALCHQESVSDQELSVAMEEELRRAVEEHAGETDPMRGRRREELLRDVYAFPRIINEVVGGDGICPGMGMLEVGSIFCKVVDSHKPVIDRFGRYPYRNAIEGRESTEEELEWIDKTGHFAEVDPDLARRVREDIAAGRWRALGACEDEDKTL